MKKHPNIAYHYLSVSIRCNKKDLFILPSGRKRLSYLGLLKLTIGYWCMNSRLYLTQQFIPAIKPYRGRFMLSKSVKARPDRLHVSSEVKFSAIFWHYWLGYHILVTYFPNDCGFDITSSTSWSSPSIWAGSVPRRFVNRACWAWRSTILSIWALEKAIKNNGFW